MKFIMENWRKFLLKEKISPKDEREQNKKLYGEKLAEFVYNFRLPSPTQIFFYKKDILSKTEVFFMHYDESGELLKTMFRGREITKEQYEKFKKTFEEAGMRRKIVHSHSENEDSLDFMEKSKTLADDIFKKDYIDAGSFRSVWNLGDHVLKTADNEEGLTHNEQEVNSKIVLEGLRLGIVPRPGIFDGKHFSWIVVEKVKILKKNEEYLKYFPTFGHLYDLFTKEYKERKSKPHGLEPSPIVQEMFKALKPHWLEDKSQDELSPDGWPKELPEENSKYYGFGVFLSNVYRNAGSEFKKPEKTKKFQDPRGFEWGLDPKPINPGEIMQNTLESSAIYKIFTPTEKEFAKKCLRIKEAAPELALWDIKATNVGVSTEDGRLLLTDIYIL